MFRWRPAQRTFQGLRSQFQPPYRQPQLSWQPGPLCRPSQSRNYRVKFGGARPQYRRWQQAGNLFQRWAARPTFYRDVGLISLGSGGFYVYNLEEVPVSGRRRFNIIPPTLERYVAEATLQDVVQTYQDQFLPDHDPRVRQVKKVLERLLPFVGEGMQGTEWEVHVIDDPDQQNAFVIPGGKVFVFTGILPLCGSEDGIAAVMGHEIAHVVARHQAEDLSKAPIILVGCAALMMFDLSFSSSQMLLDLFLKRPASRKHEAEADYIGLLMMAQACYRPEAAAELWARMERSSTGQAPPQFLSTHPSNANREAKIREWIPEAQEKQEHSQCHGMLGFVDQWSAFEKAWR